MRTLHVAPEAHVDRKEMARILNVSVRTLDRMVAAGEIPSETWGRRTRRFRPSLVLRAFNGAQSNSEAA